MSTGQPGLPPELDALKRTVRQIVKDECAPQGAHFLANPLFEGDDDGGSRGIAEALIGIVGTLPPGVLQRLTTISKETGIYTSFVPKEYGGGGTSEIHKFVMARGLLDGRVDYQG